MLLLCFLYSVSALFFFIPPYSNILLPTTYLFFICFLPIVIKLSCARVLAVMEKLQSNETLVLEVFFCTDLVLGILKVSTTNCILALRD